MSRSPEREGRIDPDTLKAITQFLSLAMTRYNVDQAYLFGSCARGTQGPDSDVDVALVISRDDQELMSVAGDLADVAFDLAFDTTLGTGILISPFPIFLDEWENPERYSNPALLANIRREGIPLTLKEAPWKS